MEQKIDPKEALKILADLRTKPLGELTEILTVSSGLTNEKLLIVEQDTVVARRQKGAKGARKKKAEKATARHKMVHQHATYFAQCGYAEKDIPGMTSRRTGLTTRRTRDILKKTLK